MQPSFMAWCQIMAEPGQAILVLCVCAVVLFCWHPVHGRAGAAQHADTLRDQRRERRRARAEKEPRSDAPRPRRPSSVEHVSANGIVATPLTRHDPTGRASVSHRTPVRSEDGTSSRRLIQVVASHATVKSSRDCERPKAQRDGKDSRFAPGFAQPTSRDALTAAVPLPISSSIQRLDAPRSNELVALWRRETIERETIEREQHAEESPANLAHPAQAPFNTNASTVTVSAESPVPRRTMSFARMVGNTREAPKTPGAPPTPISLRSYPNPRGTTRITLREYSATL